MPCLNGSFSEIILDYRIVNEKKGKKVLAAKRTTIVFLSFLFAFLTPFRALAQTQTKSISNGSSIIRLKNGLRIILLRRPEYPLVSCQLWYHIGGKCVDQKRRGSSYAVKHFLDIEPLVSNHSVAKKLIENAAQFDSVVSDDFTAFIVNAEAGNLKECLKIQNARLNIVDPHPKWIRSGVKESIKKYRIISPSLKNRLHKQVRALALPDLRREQSLSKSTEELFHSSASKVKRFYREKFLKAPVTLVLAGNFETENAMSLIKEIYSNSRGISVDPYPLNPPAEQLSQRSFSRFIPGSANHIFVSYRAPKLSQKDLASLIVLESLLNNKVNGLLKNRFQANNLCTTSDALLEQKNGTCLFSIYLKSVQSTGPEIVLEDLDTLLDSLKQISVNNISLTGAKKRALLKYRKNNASPYKAAYQHGLFDAVGRHLFLAKWDDHINSVTDGDIKEVCQKFLYKEKRTIGIFKAKDLKSPTDEEYKEMNTSTTVPLDKSNIPESTTQQHPQSSNTASEVEQTSKSETSSTSDSRPKFSLANVKSKILNNGISLKVYSVPDCKVVSLFGTVNAGSRFDKPNKYGASLVNVLLMNGNSKAISEKKSRSLQANNGLNLEDLLKFESGINYASFHTTCLNEDLKTQLKLISHHLLRPNLKENKFAEAKSRAKQFVKTQNRQIESRLEKHLLRSLVAKNSPYKPINAAILLKSINNLSVADIESFRKTTIKPASLNLVAVGDISLSRLEALTNEVFKNWSTEVKPTEPQVLKNKRQILKVMVTSPGKPELLLGQLIPKSNTTNLSIIDCALFEHPLLARLPKDRFEDRIKPTIKYIGGQTLWSLNLNGSQRSIEDSFKSLKTALKSIKEKGISDQEFERLKSFIGKKQLLSNFNTLSNSARFIAQQEKGTARSQSPVYNTTFDSAINFIKNGFKPEKSCIVFALDKKSKNLAKRINLHK